MHYMLVRHGVTDFARWKRIFDGHAEAQRAAGLHLLYCLRDGGEPELVVMLFRVDDPDKARAFTETPAAQDAGRQSGVVGPAEVLLLHD